MKLFKRESSIWLSEIVQQDFRKQYPQFDLKKIQVSRWKRVLQNFPLSFRLAFAVFALGIIMNSFFLAQGWVLSTYELNSQGAYEIVASSLEYLAGLVGIVLPIILIVVEFVSRDKSASSLVDLYLEKTTLKTTTYWALGLLGFEAIFLTVFRTNIIKPSQILFSIVFLFTLLNLATIFETGKTIWNLRNSLNSTFLTTTLASKLTAEILEEYATDNQHHNSSNIHLDRIGQQCLVECLA